jgi:hypothetical protein
MNSLPVVGGNDRNAAHFRSFRGVDRIQIVAGVASPIGAVKLASDAYGVEQEHGSPRPELRAIRDFVLCLLSG